MTTDDVAPPTDGVPSDSPEDRTPAPPSRWSERLTALGEVVLCSGYPTQILLIGVLAIIASILVDLVHRALDPRIR